MEIDISAEFEYLTADDLVEIINNVREPYLNVQIPVTEDGVTKVKYITDDQIRIKNIDFQSNKITIRIELAVDKELEKILKEEILEDKEQQVV